MIRFLVFFPSFPPFSTFEFVICCLRIKIQEQRGRRGERFEGGRAGVARSPTAWRVGEEIRRRLGEVGEMRRRSGDGRRNCAPDDETARQVRGESGRGTRRSAVAARSSVRNRVFLQSHHSRTQAPIPARNGTRARR